MEFSGNEVLTNNCNVSFSNEQKTHLLIAIMSSGAVSTVMCSIAVLLVMCLKLYKYFVYRLALYQVVSCLFFSVAEALQMININYVEDTYHINACRATAFLVTYTVWVKLLLTLCLVFHIFCLAVCLKNLKNLEIAYILVSVLFPCLIVWIPFIHNFYDLAGAWCWIRDWNNDCPSEKEIVGIIEQFTLWYGPLFVSLTLCLIAVIIIIIILIWKAYLSYKIKSEQPLLLKEYPNKTLVALKELLPLLAYPIIFFVLALFPIIDRVYGAISPHGSYSLLLAHALTEASWGTFSALALLGHVLLRRNLRHQTAAPPSFTRNKIEGSTAVYTKETVASTNALSTYTLHDEESESENDTE